MKQCAHLTEIRIGKANLVRCAGCQKIKYKDFDRSPNTLYNSKNSAVNRDFERFEKDGKQVING